MKKNLGNALALYPTPLVVVGTMVNGKPNWVLVGHLGIMGHDHVMVSLAKPHHCGRGFAAPGGQGRVRQRRERGQVPTVCLHCGGIRRAHDRQRPVVMECQVEDLYETQGFDNFICTIQATFAEENVLNEQGKLEYHTLKPVLFEMPTYEYLKTGDVLAKCMSFGKAQG